MKNTAFADERDLKVIRLYIDGQTRDEIAANTGLGQGTVSRVVQRWGQALGAGRLDAVRKITFRLRRKAGGIIIDTVDKLPAAFDVLAALEAQNIDSGDSVAFIQNVIQSCIEQGISPAELVKIAINLKKMCDTAASVASIADVAGHLQNKIQELRQTQEMVDNKKREIEQINNEIDKSAPVLSDIKQYREAEHALAEYGLSIKDMQSLAGAIKNAQDDGNDLAAVAARMSRIDSIRDEEQVLQDRLASLQLQVKAEDKALQDIKAKSAAKQNAVAAVEEMLQSNKITAEQVINLSAIITKGSGGIKDMAAIASRVIEAGGLAAATQSLEAEMANLHQKIKCLTAGMAELEYRNQELQSKNSALRQEYQNTQNQYRNLLYLTSFAPLAGVIQNTRPLPALSDIQKCGLLAIDAILVSLSRAATARLPLERARQSLASEFAIL